MIPRHAVLAGGPLLIAHRGGAGLAPENTMAAFLDAAARWNADMIELDVHASADGHCVVIHDDTVDRTTSGSGPVAEFTLAELQAFDAGQHFSRDGGRTFPFRGRGVCIPTIEEVFAALPQMRLTIEVKTGAAQAPLFAAIERFGATQRVIAAGMYDADRTMFSGYGGAISASMQTLRRFYTWHRLGLGRWIRPGADVVQVPVAWEDRRIVSRRFVRDLRAHDVPVHVWTVNDAVEMRTLLDWGVDGILSDLPDVLGQVLHDERGRPLAPGHTAAEAGG